MIVMPDYSVNTGYKVFNSPAPVKCCLKSRSKTSYVVLKSELIILPSQKQREN